MVHVADGQLFPIYLILFGFLRFFVFTVRGNVPVVAWGLRNGQWTALVLIAITVPMLLAYRARTSNAAGSSTR